MLVIMPVLVAGSALSDPGRIRVLVSDFDTAGEPVPPEGTVEGWFAEVFSGAEPVEPLALGEQVAPELREASGLLLEEYMLPLSARALVTGSITGTGSGVEMEFTLTIADNTVEYGQIGEPVSVDLTTSFPAPVDYGPDSRVYSTVRFQAMLFASMILMNEGLHDQALETVEAALALGSGMDDRELLSKAFSVRGTLWMVGYERLESAVSDLDQAVRLDPMNAQALQNRAVIHLAEGSFAMALDDLTALAGIRPGNPDIIFTRAELLYGFGMFREALEGYDAYLLLSPDCPMGHFGRGLSRMELYRTEEGLEDLLRVIELDPGYIQAYPNAALGFYQTGNTDAAREILDRALRMDPDHLDTYSILVFLDLTGGDLEDALRHSNTGISLAPDDPFFRKTRGMVYFEWGMFDEAREDFEFVAGQFALGNFGSDFDPGQEQVEETLERLSRFLDLPRDSGEFHYERGLFFMWTGEPDRAEADMTMALEIAPELYEAHLQRGFCRAYLGDFPGASDDLEAFLRLSPEDNEHTRAARSLLEELR